MMTKIKRCACKHAYQDRLYGEFKRVHNKLRTAPGKPDQWRCTVCQSVRG